VANNNVIFISILLSLELKFHFVFLADY